MNIETIAERRGHWLELHDRGTAEKTLLVSSLVGAVWAVAYCLGVILIIFDPGVASFILAGISGYLFYVCVGKAIWANDMLDIHDERNALSTPSARSLDDLLEYTT